MSEHIKWTSDLNTNIHVIDEQHKKIVEFINQLVDVHGAEDRMIISDVISELVDYTVSHFAYEEALMEQAGYPFLEPHKKVHKLFVDKVNAYVKRFESGEDIVKELIALLKKWLINHIRNEDGDYVDIVAAVQDKIHHAAKGGLLTRVIRKLF